MTNILTHNDRRVLLETKMGFDIARALPEALTYANSHPTETVVFRHAGVEVLVESDMSLHDLRKEWDKKAIASERVETGRQRD